MTLRIRLSDNCLATLLDERRCEMYKDLDEFRAEVSRHRNHKRCCATRPSSLRVANSIAKDFTTETLQNRHAGVKFIKFDWMANDREKYRVIRTQFRMTRSVTDRNLKFLERRYRDFRRIERQSNQLRQLDPRVFKRLENRRKT